MEIRRIGNYRIIDYVGSGGFGSVFKAEDINTPGRIVAIKELHKKHTRSAVIKQRFFQEAVAMARLDHPNLPRLYTFGEDNGCYYLVMEFISGKLLTDEISQTGPMNPARAVSIISQVLDAVSYANRSGIIHRDLKPDNIMLVEGGPELRVKVLDFGIARMVGGESLTLVGEGFGTPTYMSPERIASTSEIDQRTDIYSVGIILFEMLAGRAPFESKTTDPAVYWSEMRRLHETESLPSLAEFGVGTEIETVVKKATAKQVENRYTTADEMLAGLRGSAAIQPAAVSSEGAARLALTTLPGAAEVYVDDVLRGYSDEMRGKILIDGLTTGLHTVKVLKQGYNEYRINVLLEAGRQTDLQVALAARATMAMPPSIATTPVDATTERIQNEGEARTAMLLVEGVPAGSTVFVGTRPVTIAEQDGRATVKLPPGVHEIQVTAPSGVSRRQEITVGDQETGSLKTVTLPFPQTKATRAIPRGSSPDRAGNGKRVAFAAAVVMMGALALATVFVLRGPGSSSGEPSIASTAPQPSGAETQPNASSPSPDTQTLTAETERLRRENEALKKKQQEEQKNKEQDAASGQEENKLPGSESAPASTAPPIPTPPTAEPSAQETRPGSGCVVVTVKDANGSPVPRVIVSIGQLSSDAAVPFRGRTNERGRIHQCGLTPGRAVSILVRGPAGALLGGKQAVVSEGLTAVEVQLSSVPARISSPDDNPSLRPRRRPFPKRP
ncbi:MAG TPA: protein kinase [Blastocatellia bacterium]|nr:protein kinase [Blastocatellia bacterium]